MTWSFPAIASLLIFIGTYVLISVHRIRFLNLDRPSASLAGAVLMVLLGVVPFDEALRSAVNWETILLLLGMMIVVASLKLTRFFEFVSTWILIRAGSPRRLLALLIAASGVLSALFVNDTICVLFTPVVLAAVLRAKLNPVPFLIALVTSANIGSVMTLTGNPQNMLVGIFSRIPYGIFFLYLLPVGLLGLVLDWLILRRLYARELEGSFDTAGLSLPDVDRPALLRIMGVVALISLGFLLPLERWLPGLEAGQKLPLVALAGAALAVLVGRARPSEAFAQVDWGLLVFFAGLFVVIAGINRTGILPALHARAAPLFGPAGGGLTLFTVAMSNLVSNVPYVLAVEKWISGSYAWTLIAMASTFAGNLTIVGSVANMIVLELSRHQAKIGFAQYLKAGAPVTIVTTMAGFLILYLFHTAGWL
ncbi:MAG TPA: SLC13 family permease [Planctomycetota bacterium]|nr:SLC13 family permease [Planctomycetota bacterium]